MTTGPGRLTGPVGPLDNLLAKANGDPTQRVLADTSDRNFTKLRRSLDTLTGNLNHYAPSVFNVLGFGAKGDGLSDDTVAIQRAIDAAGAISGNTANRGNVFLPSGNYRFTQLVLPNGVSLRGVGIGGYGSKDAGGQYGTELRQIVGTNDDGIVLAGSVGSPFVGPIDIRDMILQGDSAATAGSAVMIAKADGTVLHAADTSTFKNLLVRGWKDDGIHFTSGALPVHVEDCNFLFNGRYGIYFTADVFGGSVQAVHFDNISGDGNLSGLIYCTDITQEWGSVLFTNIKSEKRTNTDFASATGQENAIIFNNCAGPMAVVGLTHISSVPSGGTYEVPGPAIKCTGVAVPSIVFSAVAVRVRAGDVGTTYTLQDTTNSIAIPYTVHAGMYGPYHLYGSLSLGASLTTHATSYGVLINSGTNAGANNKDAYKEYQRGGTALWRTGLLGTVNPDGRYRLYDVAGTTVILAAASTIADFFHALSTEAISPSIAINCGTNAGANDQNSTIRWKRAASTKWQGGLFGSNWQLFDSVNGVAAITITPGAVPSIVVSAFGATTFTGLITANAGIFSAGNVTPAATDTYTLGASGAGWQSAVIEHAASRASGLGLIQTAAATDSPRIFFVPGSGGTVWAVRASGADMLWSSGGTFGTASGTARMNLSITELKPSANGGLALGAVGQVWSTVFTPILDSGSGTDTQLKRNNVTGFTIGNGVNVSAVPIRLKSYTVATLPAGTQGDTAYVTDALAPAFLTALVGGGAVVTPCFYNGTNWVAM